MKEVVQTAEDLCEVVQGLIPRILTQVSRDPNSKTYGSFDRDWWHYRIRDFSSTIIQQGGYALWLAGQLDELSHRTGELTQLAAASCRFWNQRAIRHGAFEEYYPWEQGYAPAAFSTLAVMKLLNAHVVDKADVESGAAVAAKQLLTRFEAQAGNQQVAGLAALAWIRKSFPDLVPDEDFSGLTDRTLALQNREEGWYGEYGGPDLAYLSVTIDCLWDLFDATRDKRFIASATKALEFISRYVTISDASIGMHNARNSDYILPYGLTRFMDTASPAAGLAATVFDCLFNSVKEPHHFIHAIDDRYLCHYSGHSFIRACLLVRRLRTIPDAPHANNESEVLLKHCGHYIRQQPSERGLSIILSLKKGGILTASRDIRKVSDFGWVVTDGCTQHVSHWWSDAWDWNRNGNTFTVRGPLVPHREEISTPVKHQALRILSFLFGNSLIPALKNRLIFKNSRSPFTFERTVTLAADSIKIEDTISGLPERATVKAAPRSSKRHVSSADSFHDEDLCLADDVNVERSERREDGLFLATTRYILKGPQL